MKTKLSPRDIRRQLSRSCLSDKEFFLRNPHRRAYVRRAFPAEILLGHGAELPKMPLSNMRAVMMIYRNNDGDFVGCFGVAPPDWFDTEAVPESEVIGAMIAQGTLANRHYGGGSSQQV